MDNAIAVIDWINTAVVLAFLSIPVIAWMVAFRHGKDEAAEELRDQIQAANQARAKALLRLEAARMANRTLAMKVAISTSPLSVRN